MVGPVWLELGELTLAFLLSALVGVEREIRQRSAGLKTYALVGLASALFMLVSKYGFADVLSPYRVVLDPSRVAAQVVSGIGFIGGGVIFMRRDVVRGLTTAASVWVTAALGMACGAGLIVLAITTTAAYFVIVFAFPVLAKRLPGDPAILSLHIRCHPSLMEQIVNTCTGGGVAVSDASCERAASEGGGVTEDERSELVLTLRGPETMLATLVARVGALQGVSRVSSMHARSPEA